MPKTPTISGSTQGLRERSKRDRLARIAAAARSLFEELPFDEVSTGEVARRADVAAGTVFRYAATKGELYLLVVNEAMREAMAEGSRAAADASDVDEAIRLAVAPILERLAALPDGGGVYQRELLFGADEERRREGLELVSELEARIAAMLAADAVRRGLADDEDRALRAAEMIFGVVQLGVARASTRPDAARAIPDLADRIRIASAGYRAGLAPASEPGRPD